MAKSSSSHTLSDALENIEAQSGDVQDALADLGAVASADYHARSKESAAKPAPSMGKRAAVKAPKKVQPTTTAEVPEPAAIDDFVDFDDETFNVLRSAQAAANDTAEATQQAQLSLSKASIAVDRVGAGLPWFAIIGSTLWLLGTALWAFVFPITQGLPADDLFTMGRVVMFVIAAVLPIALFLTAAVFMRRAQDMAQASQLLAASAVRLLDPETIAHGTISSVGGAVRREISALTDGFEQAVARAGELETLVQSEVSSVEAAYVQNETRLRGLIDALVEQRNAILAEGESLKQVVADSQTVMSNNLSTVTNSLNQMVDQVTARTQSSLDEKSQEIVHQIMDVSSRVIAALAERTDDVAISLQQAETSIVSNIQATGDALTSSVVERVSMLTDDLTSKGNTLLDALTDQQEKLDVTFNKTANQVLEAISDRSRDSNDSLRMVVDTLLTEIMLRGTELTAKWDEVGIQVGQQLSDQSVEAAKKLIESQTRLQNLMKTTLNEIEERIQASEQRLAETMKSQAIEVASAIDHQKKETAERLGQIGVDVSRVIGQQIVEVQSSIEGRVEEMMEQLGTQGSALTEALDERLGELNTALSHATEHLESGHTMLSDSIDKLQELTAETLTTSTLQLADILKSTVMGTSDELLEKTSMALDAMNNKASEVLDGFESRSSATINEFKTVTTLSLDRVDSNIAEFESRIVDSTKSYSEAWEQRMSGFDENVVKQLQAVFVQFDERINHIDQTLGQRTLHLNDVFETSTAALANTLEHGTSGVLGDIESRTAQLAQVLDEKRNALVEHLDLHKSATETVFGSHVKALKSSLDETLVGLEEHINKDASLIANTMNLHTLQMVQNIQMQAEQASDVLKIRSDELEAVLKTRTEAIDQLVNGDLLNLNSALTDRTATLFTLINEQGQGYIEQLNTNGQALAERIEFSASKAVELLNSTNELFSQALNTGMTDLGKTILDAHQSIKDTLSSQGQDSVDALRDTQVALSITLADAVEKLNAQNSQLSHLVEMSQQQLRTLGQELAGHIGQFHEVTTGAAVHTEETLTRLANQVNLMQQTTHNVIRDAQQVTTEFEAHHTAIAETIRHMDESTQSVQVALVDRREGLKHIAQMIVEAATEIDTKLGNTTDQIGEKLAQTTAQIDQSLNSASARIDETFNYSSEFADRFSDSLKRVADQAGREVLAQFERMTLAAGDESMRASESVKRAYEEVAEEMAKAMRHATQEFTASTTGLKALVAEVQNEIISTRNTLSASLRDLPSETQASTAELRRVVADQLRALNDLSDLIARQSTRMDVSVLETPVAAAPVELQGKQKPSWFSGQRPAQAEVSTAIHETVAPRFAEALQPSVSEDQQVVSPQNAPARGQNPNWLKEMLTKAESEESASLAEPAEKPVVSSYSFGAATFGADLAKAVDSEMIADVWARYQNNERNAFNRRLYTVSGQSTFDEVRRRYRRDEDFRAAVDRYTQDFETLIAAVSKNDKSSEMVMSYLTSDTGKVYTLLSHAAGNLG